jgi:hypothetical protein
MEAIKNELNKRPVTDSTKSLYIKKLEMLREGINEEWADLPEGFTFLTDSDKVLEYISQFKFAKKKSLLNAAMVGLYPASKIVIPENVELDDKQEAYKIYRDLNLSMGKDDKKANIEQMKTLKESDKWTTMKQLEKVRNKYARELKKKGYTQKTTQFRDKLDKETLQKLLVSTLYTTQPPRRLEYGNMSRIDEKDYFKLDAKDKENNNYIVTKNRNKKYFSFGDVKVPDPDNRVLKIPINKVLNGVINTWFSLTDGDSFLQNSRGDRQTSNGLSKFLIQKVFKSLGNIGAGMIRHIFLSEKYQNDTPLKEKTELAKLMNHSANTAETIYVKKD